VDARREMIHTTRLFYAGTRRIRFGENSTDTKNTAVASRTIAGPVGTSHR
jgi:hypothetical protein